MTGDKLEVVEGPDGNFVDANSLSGKAVGLKNKISATLKLFLGQSDVRAAVESNDALITFFDENLEDEVVITPPSEHLSASAARSLLEEIVIEEQGEPVLVVPTGIHTSVLHALNQQGHQDQMSARETNIQHAQHFIKALRTESKIWEKSGAARDYVDSRDQFVSLDLINLANKYGIPFFFFKKGGHYLLPLRFPPQNLDGSWHLPLLDSFTGMTSIHHFETLNPSNNLTPDQLLNSFLEANNDEERLIVNPIAADYLRHLARNGLTYDLTRLSDNKPNAEMLARIKQGALQNDVINCGGYALWYQMLHWAALVNKPLDFHDTFVEPGRRDWMPPNINTQISGRQRLFSDSGIYIASAEELHDALKFSTISIE